MHQIVYHKNNDKAINRAEQKFVDSRGKQQYKRSTKGWEVCVRWKNGSTTLEKLSDFKECYPVQTDKYTATNDIDTEPAFNYWVPHTLRKSDSIISLVKKRQTRYLKKTHKFGIEMPNTVKEAAKLDANNGDTKWMDAISKEIASIHLVSTFFASNLAAYLTVFGILILNL